MRRTTGRGLAARPSGAGKAGPLSPARARSLRVLPVVLALSTLVGCVRGCPSSRPPIHVNPNMDLQGNRAQTESRFFYDGSTMRLPIPGTVARGELRDASPLWSGLDADGLPVLQNPLALDDALLARGEQRYAIYCSPCHDPRGTGRGILAQQGVLTPSFRDPRLREAPDGQLFIVITNGQGMMPAYRWPIPVADRWAIVAWVRTLQEDAR